MNPPAAIRGRHGRLIGFSVIATGLITSLRILLVTRLSDRGFFVKYVQFADQILAGRVPRARLGDVSPGYLWTTVALRFLHATAQEIITVQIIEVTLAALCLAVCAWRLAGPVAALGAGVVLLANRAALVCATELEPETLILLMGSIGLAAVGTFAATNAALPDEGGRRARGGRSILLVAGSAFGISAICRPVALLVIAGLAVWLWPKTRHGAISFLAAAAAPIAIVLAVNTALSGEALIMDPGTVFFEGMNPLAAGYAGVQPRIVNDLEAASSEPDFLHVAYRIVAARATGAPMNRSASNHYWSSKAWSFVRTEPAAAIRLTLRKLILACQSYDAYDLSTMVRKSDAMDRLPWLPFGFVLALAVAALLMSHGEAVLMPPGVAASAKRRTLGPPSGGGLADVSSVAISREILTPIVIVILGNAVSLAAFYVTARGRNALLPGLSLLAGIGIALLVDIARRDRRRALVVLLLILASTLILGLDGDAQREDRYGWSASFHAGAAQSAAQAATARGALRDAAVFRAIAATWRPADWNAVDRPLLAAVALKELGEEASPERRFDLALALQKGGDWSSSATVLDALSAAGYRPRRENRAVSSVAFYRARAALRLGSAALARQHLAVAAREAPGDPYVLALRTIVEPQPSATRRELDELHDPFTASLAIATAQADGGDTRAAAATLEALIRAFPEWTRPRAAAAMMR